MLSAVELILHVSYSPERDASRLNIHDFRSVNYFTCMLALRGAGATVAAAPPPPPFAHGGSGGQLCPFLKAIELFYHPNNFASDVRNVINESDLIIAGVISRHCSF